MKTATVERDEFCPYCDGEGNRRCSAHFAGFLEDDGVFMKTLTGEKQSLPAHATYVKTGVSVRVYQEARDAS